MHNEIEKNKPHGLGIGFKAEVFDNINGELVPVKVNEENGSKLEAYINIKNEKTGKEAELPMRSFVQTFLTILFCRRPLVRLGWCLIFLLCNH
jgi:hypothetical protein